MIEKEAAAQSLAINPFAVEEVRQAEAAYTSKDGELITLPPAEHAEMLKTIASVGSEVSSKNPRSPPPTRS